MSASNNVLIVLTSCDEEAMRTLIPYNAIFRLENPDNHARRDFLESVFAIDGGQVANELLTDVGRRWADRTRSPSCTVDKPSNVQFKMATRWKP